MNQAAENKLVTILSCSSVTVSYSPFRRFLNFPVPRFVCYNLFQYSVFPIVLTFCSQ
jgi:hypothetical protein